MNMRRSFLLLEVVIGLALLATVGVAIARLQAAAVQQVRQAAQARETATRVQELLWSWGSSGERVTLPATGVFDDRTTWRRESQPVRVASGVLATQISVVVIRAGPGHAAEELYRVDWLIPPRHGHRR
jgi:type II secretory pathway pseudopilin PulG